MVLIVRCLCYEDYRLCAFLDFGSLEIFCWLTFSPSVIPHSGSWTPLAVIFVHSSCDYSLVHLVLSLFPLEKCLQHEVWSLLALWVFICLTVAPFLLLLIPFWCFSCPELYWSQPPWRLTGDFVLQRGKLSARSRMGMGIILSLERVPSTGKYFMKRWRHGRPHFPLLCGISATTSVFYKDTPFLVWRSYLSYCTTTDPPASEQLYFPNWVERLFQEHCSRI